MGNLKSCGKDLSDCCFSRKQCLSFEGYRWTDNTWRAYKWQTTGTLYSVIMGSKKALLYIYFYFYKNCKSGWLLKRFKARGEGPKTLENFIKVDFLVHAKIKFV